MPWSDEDFIGNAFDRVRTKLRTIITEANADLARGATPSDELLRLETFEDGLWSLDLDRMGETERVEATEKQAAAIEALPDEVLPFTHRVNLAGILSEAAAAERRNLDPSELPPAYGAPR